MPRLYTSRRFGNFFWEAGRERLAPVHPGAEASRGQGWACFLSPSVPPSQGLTSPLTTKSEPPGKRFCRDVGEIKIRVLTTHPAPAPLRESFAVNILALSICQYCQKHFPHINLFNSYHILTK